MSLDKAIKHGKEHRKPYRSLAKSIDPSCRNHGSCPWCLGNRMHKHVKKQQKMDDSIKDFRDLELYYEQYKMERDTQAVLDFVSSDLFQELLDSIY